MPGWTLVDDDPTQGRTFQRQLDVLEQCFLWDGIFNGTGDSVHHYELSAPVDGAHLFSEANIIRAWLSTKRRYPLAGTVVCSVDGGPLQIAPNAASGFTSEPCFVVREQDLDRLREGEIEFGCVENGEEARQRAGSIFHGPRPLSETLLAKLYVLREPEPDRVHVLVLLAHCITDGAGNRTFLRCLLDTLARGDSEVPAQAPLETRLAMVVPWTELVPGLKLSPAVRRWRRAAAMVIVRARKVKGQGGHTLPCRQTRSTWRTAARSGLASTSLTVAQTAAVLANCRSHDVTFGNTFLALAQVAMTRVLYRRYLRGEISEEEWEYRKRQPHINGGPLSFRRYLDETWFNGGGGGEFVLCISLFLFRLPFMTLGAAAEGDQRSWSDGAPPLEKLLTLERFLHRARLVQRQVKVSLGHPLFWEIIHAVHLLYTPVPRQRALQWLQRTQTANGRGAHENSDEDKVLAATEAASMWAHGGSSLGNMTLMIPSEYPLPPTHPLSPCSPASHPAKAGYELPLSDAEATQTTRIKVEDSRVHLHARPSELYLGAATTRGQMELYVHYDGNVFEDGVVREWLDEVRAAVLWYLGRGESGA